jgi:Zn finger protein HypA/HybF involved in hydrogenase expression
MNDKVKVRCESCEDVFEMMAEEFKDQNVGCRKCSSRDLTCIDTLEKED